jgi:sec-independent protein translocase protein TatC
MEYWGHVCELRRRLIVVVFVLAALSALGYVAAPCVVRALQVPLDESLYATTISEGFGTRIRAALVIGGASTVPFLAGQCLAFLAPALTRRQRTIVTILLACAFVLFVVGAVFALRAVVPLSIRFLTSDMFFPDGVGRLVSYRSFFGFVVQFVFGFGLFFELPILLIVLLKLSVIDRRFLRRNFGVLVGLICVLAAVMTPPDVVSQLLLAIPMIVLYGLTITVARILRIG